MFGLPAGNGSPANGGGKNRVSKLGVFGRGMSDMSCETSCAADGCELLLAFGVRSNAPPVGVNGGEDLSVFAGELGIDLSSAEISEVSLLVSEDGENDLIFGDDFSLDLL